MLSETSEKIEAAFANRRVLVTGGLGFLGSNVIRHLVELNADVTVVDSLSPKYGGNLFNVCGLEDRIRINISDVRDEHSLGHLVRGQDFLLNLAGQTSHLDSMRDPCTDLEINCRAQLFILEACRRHNPQIRIVFASTRQLYGKPDYLPVDERHAARPVDVNGINKLAGEWYHLLYHRVYGIRACALRLTNTYGPCMRVRDARQTFLGIWIRSLVEGRPFEVWDGSQRRDYTYADDAVEAFLLAGASEEAYGHVFNVGGNAALSLRETADLLVEVNGGGSYDVRPLPEDRLPIEIGDYYTDDRLIRRALGWAPKVPVREGLARTLAYYRTHLEHYL